MSGAQGRIAILGGGHRFWVLAPVRGASGPLLKALDLIQTYFQPGDHVVCLGNQIGPAGQSKEVMKALVNFQAWVADQKTDGQVLWLRGAQEALLDQFYTLHFAPDVSAVLTWMMETHGFDQLMAQFGVSMEHIEGAMGQGAAALARLTSTVREEIRSVPAHAAYLDGCTRAAVSDTGQLLFVHAGVDPARTLSLQTDAFWWGHPDFFRMTTPYQSFSLTLSGLVPHRVENDDRTLDMRDPKTLAGPGRLAIDGGCGLGGVLLAFCFDPRGKELFRYEFAE